MVWDRGEHQAVRLGFVLPLTRGRPRSPGAELIAVPRTTTSESWPGEIPEGLCRALIEAATEPGEPVVDPFCGSLLLCAQARDHPDGRSRMVVVDVPTRIESASATVAVKH